jgi:molybdopterin molybdotransferase
MMAVPLTGHGSGDFANLADADGFLELPPDQQLFHKGDAFPFWRFR